MKNKKVLYASSVIPAIAAVSLAVPAMAEEQEGQANIEGGTSKEYVPSIFAQSGNGEKVLFIGGNADYDIYSNGDSGYSYAKNDLLSNNYQVEQKRFSSITKEDLFQTDIVVIHIHSVSRAITDAEVTMFRDYVLKGGALLILGELHTTSSFDVSKLNGLASVFGIEFLNGLMIDETNSLFSTDAAAPSIEKLQPHPITEGIASTWLNYGTALKVTSPAKALAFSGPNSYLETNSRWDSWNRKWTYSKDFADTAGPLPVLAASEFGLGRVIATGDSGIFRNYDYMTRSSNELFANMVNWLKVANIHREVVLEAIYPAQENASKIMAGGAAIRTYRLKDESGVPLKNYTIQYEIDGKVKSAKSDKKGNIQIMTPVLKAGADQQLTFEVLGTSFKSSFTVDVIPRQFEQKWMMTAAVNGSVGVGVGVDGKIGQLASLDVGAEASLNAGIRSTLMMKYLIDGKDYDLMMESEKAGTGGASGSIGLQGQLHNAVDLSVASADGEVELQTVLGANMLYKNFNNPENYKNALSFAMPLFYETLAMGSAQSKKVANNQFVQFLMEELKREMRKNEFNAVGIYSRQGLSAEIGADLLTGSIDLGNANVEAGALAGSLGASASIQSELKSNGDRLLKSTVNGSMSGSVLNAAGSYTTASDTELAKDFSVFEGEFAIQAEEEMLYQGTKLKEYSFAMASEEDTNGSAFGEEKEEADITKIKYTVDTNNVANFNAASVVKKALENKVAIFNHPMDTLDSLLGLKTGTGQLQFEEIKVKEESFEFPLEVGIGVGPKLGVGFELAGATDIEYTSEQGVFMKGDAQYLTAAYQYDDVIKKQEKELTTVFNSAGDMVGEALSDAFYTAKETIEGWVGTAINFGKDAVDATTKKIVEMKDDVTNIIEVGLHKVVDYFPFSIQTENGEAIVLGELFFLTFNDEQKNPVYDLGDTTVPLVMGYPEDMIDNLGLKGKEASLAIYRWDEEKVTYVRMDSTVDAENNTVSTDTSLAGQYILAYNEFDPRVHSVDIQQTAHALSIAAVVQEDFEQIDPSSITLEVGGRAFNEQDFFYNPSTGELVLTVDYFPYNTLIEGSIKIDGEVVESFSHLMLESDVYVTEQQAIVTPENVTFIAGFDKENAVKNASIEYRINAGNEAYVPLVKQGDLWVATVDPSVDISEVSYKIVYETQANERKETGMYTAQSAQIVPLALVDDSLAFDYQETVKPVVLTFNHPLSEQSKLEQIRVVDRKGQDVAVTKTIRNHQLVIVPAYDILPGEVEIIIPSATLQTKYDAYQTNAEPITFTYEAVNMQQLDIRSANQPWTITFSEAVEGQLEENAAYVTDLAGNVVATKLNRSPEGNKLIVTPIDAYEIGHTYILHVDKALQNEDKTKTLRKSAVRLFTIE